MEKKKKIFSKRAYLDHADAADTSLFPTGQRQLGPLAPEPVPVLEELGPVGVVKVVPEPPGEALHALCEVFFSSGFS